MQVTCCVCVELLSPSDDLSSVPCGHVFHTLCILQWFSSVAGKPNCPQCRATCNNEKQLRRVYFTEGVDVSASQANDPQQMQAKIDSLTFQLRCAETDKKKFGSERDDLGAKNVALREEFRDLERRKNELAEELNGVRTQIRYFQSEKTKAKQAKEEAEELREKLKLFESVEVMVKGSLAEVNHRLHEIGDFSPASRELSIMILAMKKEMHAGKDERDGLRRELRERAGKVRGLKDLLAEQSRQLVEAQQSSRAAQSDLRHAEAEKGSLRTKLDLLQAAVDSPSGDARGSAISRMVMESPAPPPRQRLPVMPSFTQSSTSSSTATMSSPSLSSASQDDQQSPYLRTKSNGLVGLKNLKRSPCKDATNVLLLGQLNIMKKKRLGEVDHGKMTTASQKLQRTGTFVDLGDDDDNDEQEHFFDGLGGHSKPDQFPKHKPKGFKLRPIPAEAASKKPKGISRVPKSAVNMSTINKYFSFDAP